MLKSYFIKAVSHLYWNHTHARMGPREIGAHPQNIYQADNLFGKKIWKFSILPNIYYLYLFFSSNMDNKNFVILFSVKTIKMTSIQWQDLGALGKFIDCYTWHFSVDSKKNIITIALQWLLGPGTRLCYVKH